MRLLQLSALAITAALGLLGAVSWHGYTSHAQTSQAVVRVVTPSGSAKSNSQLDISIGVEGVQDLAGFQFVLAVDPAIFKPITARKTQFIGQSGREIVCGDPTVESAAVRLACVTLRQTPPGVNGSGIIATVTLKAVASGTSNLALKNVKLVRPDGSTIPSSVADGRLTVGGGSWWSTLHIALVAAGAILLAIAAFATIWRLRSRGATLNLPDPNEPLQGD